MFEYAISCGEGTLLDYGCTDDVSLDTLDVPIYKSWQFETFIYDERNPNTFIIGPASPDCLTGR